MLMVGTYTFHDCGVEIDLRADTSCCEADGPGIKINLEFEWFVRGSGKGYHPLPSSNLVGKALAEGKNAILEAMLADAKVMESVFAAAPALKASWESGALWDVLGGAVQLPPGSGPKTL